MIFDTICAKSNFSIDFARDAKYFIPAKVLRDQKKLQQFFQKTHAEKGNQTLSGWWPVQVVGD